MKYKSAFPLFSTLAALVIACLPCWHREPVSEGFAHAAIQTTGREGFLPPMESGAPSPPMGVDAVNSGHAMENKLAQQTVSAEVQTFRLLGRLPEPVIPKPLLPGDPVPSAVTAVKSSSVIDRASLRPLASLKVGTSISFPLPEGGWIPGKITYHKIEPASGRISISGHLADKPGHHFSLFSKDGDFSATLLLLDEQRALVIQQDENGRLLLQDKPIDSVICQKMPQPDMQTLTASPSAGGQAAAVVVPLLDSRPTATEVIYLDFDGEVVTDPSWAGGNTITAEPAKILGSPITPDQVTLVWEMVSEDFRPFNVTVTTDASRYHGAPPNKRSRCIVTPTDTASPNSGGVAYIDSFSRAGSSFSATIPCWAFNDNSVTEIAMTISHEIGHVLGLSHDGLSATETQPSYSYYSGHGSGNGGWGPLMGTPFYKKVSHWSRGEYFGANNTEDDLALITRAANTFGYAPDDVGDTTVTARTVDGNMTGILEESGSIHLESDVDYFRFNTIGGTFRVVCGPNPEKTNLNTRLELRDSSDSLIAQSSPDGDLTSSINLHLAAGEYFLKVTSQGEGNPMNDPPTGYTRYGSLGDYHLSGVFAAVLGLQPASQHMTSAGAERSFEVSASGGWSWSLEENATWITCGEASDQNGDETFTFTVAPNTTSWPRRATFKLVSGNIIRTHTLTQEAAMAGGSAGWGKVVAWGEHGQAQQGMPKGLSGVMAVAAGSGFDMALKMDGTVMTWKRNSWLDIEVPQGLDQVVAIDAGFQHCLALKNDGTVVAWGSNAPGQSSVPPDLTRVIAIAAGDYRSLALKDDGTVVHWGGDRPPTGLTNVVAIAAAAHNSMALKGDGTVVVWGSNSSGLNNVPENLGRVIAIGLGERHAVALRADGTVRQWGVDYGLPPATLSGVTAISCGMYHTLALKNDGTVVAWGESWTGQTRVPAGLTGVTSISAGGHHSVALTAAQTFTAYPGSRSVNAQGGLRSCAVTAIGDWSWSVSPDSDWITVAGPPSLSGHQVLQYMVAANDQPTPRSAVIIVTNGFFSNRHFITQDGMGGVLVDRPLVALSRKVPAVRAGTPDTVGVLALSGTPAKNVTKLKQGVPAQFFSVQPGTGVTVTATTKTGHIFSHWEGLPAGAQVRGNGVTFTMPGHDVPALTAVFIANPFTTQPSFIALGAKPSFQGLLLPDEGTPPSNQTVGFLTAALTPSTGSLTGKLSMNGLVTSFTAFMHGDGSIWFKTGTIMTAKLVFAGRELAMSWTADGLGMTVVGPADATSRGLARPPLYGTNRPVRGGLLNLMGRQGYYTLALPAVEQSPVKAMSEYPQGTGQAGLTLLSSGNLSLTGILADGTKVTASGYLSTGDEAEIFLMLATPGGTTKGGCVIGTLIFNETQADSDVSSSSMRWFRPVALTKATVAQAYRAGWPEGIALGAVGALYNGSATVQTTLGLDPATPSGNAKLLFSGGKLAAAVPAVFKLEASKVVKLNAKDMTWSLTLVPKTGMMSGTFTPDWTSTLKKLVPFNGVLLPKGTNQGGWGHFISNQTGDLNPEGGSVTLQKSP